MRQTWIQPATVRSGSSYDVPGGTVRMIVSGLACARATHGAANATGARPSAPAKPRRA